MSAFENLSDKDREVFFDLAKQALEKDRDAQSKFMEGKYLLFSRTSFWFTFFSALIAALIGAGITIDQCSKQVREAIGEKVLKDAKDRINGYEKDAKKAAGKVVEYEEQSKHFVNHLPKFEVVAFGVERVGDGSTRPIKKEKSWPDDVFVVATPKSSEMVFTNYWQDTDNIYIHVRTDRSSSTLNFDVHWMVFRAISNIDSGGEVRSAK